MQTKYNVSRIFAFIIASWAFEVAANVHLSPAYIADSLTLVKIDNTNTHLRYQLRSGPTSLTQFNALQFRASEDLFLLEPAKRSTPIVLTIEPIERISQEPSFRLASRSIHPEHPLYKAAKQLQELYSNWQEKTPESRERSLSIAKTMHQNWNTYSKDMRDWLPDATVVYLSMLYQQFDLNTLIDSAKEALSSGDTHEDRALRNIHYLLGLAYLDLEEYEKSTTHVDIVLGCSRKTSCKETEFNEYLDIETLAIKGLITLMQGYYGNGAQLMEDGKLILESAVNYAKASGDFKLIAITLNMLTTYYHLSGEFGTTESLYETSLDFHKRSGSSRLMVETLNNYAILARSQGDFNQSRFLLRQAVAEFDSSSPADLQATIYKNLANTYLEIGSYKTAIRYYNHAIITYSKLDDKVGLFNSKLDLAKTFRLMDQLNESIVVLEGISQDLVSQYAAFASNYYSELSATHFAANNIQKTVFYLSKAFSQNTDLLMKTNKIDLWLIKCKILMKTSSNELKACLSNLVNLLGQGTDLANQRIETYELQIDNLDGLEQVNEKTDLFKAGLALIEGINKGFSGDQSSLIWKNKTNVFFQQYIAYLLEQYALSKKNNLLAEAFNVIEKHSATFLKYNRAAHASRSEYAFHESEELQTYWEIERELIRENSTNSDATKLALNKSSERILSPQENSHIPASLEIEVLSIADIQALMPSEELMLRFYMTESRGYVFSIDRESVRLRTFPLSQQIQDTIINLSTGVRVQNDNLQNSLATISNAIGFDYEEISRYKTLLIVSNDLFQLIPFSALSVQTTSSQKANIRLLDLVDITYTYSASDYYQILPSNELESADKFPNIALFVDPVFNTESEHRPKSDKDNSEHYRSWKNDLRRLSWTSKEASEIAKTFRQFRVEIAQGTEATNANLKHSNYRNADILHIATHGYFNPDDPEIVGLATSVVNSDNTSAPGFISLSELLSETFSAQLIVVSGCETMKGKNYQSEGVLSLSRGFISKGAGAVIGTLWAIPDKPTSIFMRYFYSNLDAFEGNTEKALRHAKLRMRKTGRYRNPAYWAGFVLTSASIQSKYIKFRQ